MYMWCVCSVDMSDVSNVCMVCVRVRVECCVVYMCVVFCYMCVYRCGLCVCGMCMVCVWCVLAVHISQDMLSFIVVETIVVAGSWLPLFSP